MRKLYLHIGVHRTATSSIQRFMHINSTGMAKRGVLYPFGVARHNELVNRLFDGRLDIETLIEDLKQSAESSTSEIHSLVLSDEDISMRKDLSILAPLGEHFDVRIVVFLRRQDLWLESWYLQNIKWQWIPDLSHPTFDEFLEKEQRFHWIDYDRHLGHFEELFGKDKVSVQAFEPGQMPNGPYAAFCKMIGVQDIEEMEKPKGLNQSLSPIVSEFMRNLPLGEFDTGVRARMEAACIAVDIDLRRSFPDIYNIKTHLLTHDQRTAILERFAESNSAVAQRYFNRDELFVEKLPGKKAGIATMRLPGDSYEYTDLIITPFFRHLASIIKDINAGK